MFIPWGADDTFHLKDDPNPFDNISNPPPSVLALTAIPNRLYNNAGWRVKYAARLKEILQAVWEEEELLASVDQMAAIVHKYALPEVRDAAANDAQRVRKFILKRKGEILADITPEPPDWPEPYGAAAADGVESFELRFETTWGSNWSVDPLAEGTVYELDEEGEWVAANRGEAGATAGPASPQEEGDIGVKDAGIFTVMGLYPDGAIRGVTFWIPVDRVAAEAELFIGVDAGVGGSIWTIPVGGTAPEGFIPVTAGGIQLTEAGTEPGAVITATVNADFGDAPAALEPGSAEVSFEAAWGTYRHDDPPTDTIPEGGSVSYLKIDEMEQSIESSAALAGLAGPDERDLLPDVEDLATIYALAWNEDGYFVGMVFALPMSLLTDGAALVIGEDKIAGAIWKEAATGSGSDIYHLSFTEGTLALSKAGTEPGAAIVGRFSGLIEWEPIHRPGGSGSGSKGSSMVGSAESDTWLVINEVAAKGDPLDWFEIYNSTDQHISLANFFVADDLDDAGKRVAFPSDLVISSGAYLQIMVDSDGWPGFGLGGDEELGLWTSEGVLVDSVDWDEGDAGEGVSFARLPDGTGEFHTVVPTPGEENEHHH